MLRRFLTSIGVDYGQWRALLRAYQMIDYAAIRGAYGAIEMNRVLTAMLVIAGFFTSMSVVPAILIWNTTDTFMAATILVTFSAVFVGMMTVSGIPLLISADDYTIVGFRPISSRTYLAVRTTALLLYAAQVAVLTGYLPVIAFLTRSGGSLALAGGVIAAIAATTFAVTVSVVVGYGWLLQRLGAVRTRRVVSYGQMVVTFGGMAGLAAAGYYFIDVGNPGIGFSVKDVALPRTAWLLAYPGTWFAAYVQMANGVFGRLELAAGAHSMVCLVALVALVRGRISEGYLARAAQLALDTTAPVAKPDPAWSMVRGEHRAVAVLLRHQLRADMQLQVQMVMSVAMPFLFMGIYVSTSAAAGSPEDPFAGSWRVAMSMGSLTVIGLAMMPSSMWQSITRSMTPRAVWPFFTTGSDRARIITAARDVIALFALAPTMLVSFGVYLWVIGHVGHAFLFTLLVSAFAYFELQLVVWADPVLPFSRPAMPASTGGLPFKGTGFLASMLAVPAWTLVSLVAFSGTIGYVAGVAGLIGLSAMFHRVTRRRILRRQHAMEYFE